MWAPYRYHQPRACRSDGDGLLYRLLCAHSPLCISCCEHRQLLCSVPGASTSPSRGCACSKAASGHVRGVPFRAALATSFWLIHHALPQLYNMLISHLSVPGAACRVLYAPIVTGARVRHTACRLHLWVHECECSAACRVPNYSSDVDAAGEYYRDYACLSSPHPSCLFAPGSRLGVCEFLFPVQHRGGGGQQTSSWYRPWPKQYPWKVLVEFKTCGEWDASQPALGVDSREVGIKYAILSNSH
jgi:hypothetical protein